MRLNHTVIISFTGRICPKGSSAGISFTHRPILGFFAPQGRHVAPIKDKFGREERTVGPLLTAKFDLNRFRGGGLRPPKTEKKSNFTNIIGPKGRVPCTILQNLQVLCAYSVYIILPNIWLLYFDK